MLRRSDEYGEQALGRARAVRNPAAVARALAQKSLVTAALGDEVKARSELSMAAVTHCRRGDHGGLAPALSNLGRVIEAGVGGARAAVRTYRRALAAAERSGERGLVRTCLYDLATASRAALLPPAMKAGTISPNRSSPSTDSTALTHAEGCCQR